MVPLAVMRRSLINFKGTAYVRRLQVLVGVGVNEVVCVAEVAVKTSPVGCFFVSKCPTKPLPVSAYVSLLSRDIYRN